MFSTGLTVVVVSHANEKFSTPKTNLEAMFSKSVRFATTYIP